MRKNNENSTFQTWKIPAQARKVLGTKSWTLKRGTNWVDEGTCCTKKNLTKLLLCQKGPQCQGLTNVKYEAPKKRPTPILQALETACRCKRYLTPPIKKV